MKTTMHGNELKISTANLTLLIEELTRTVNYNSLIRKIFKRLNIHNLSDIPEDMFESILVDIKRERGNDGRT